MSPLFDGKHVAGLDGLRGAAIIAVMVFHSDATSLTGGFLGVDLFFVLSGFLISAMLVLEFDGRREVRLAYFYMRRVLRLMPALMLLLLLFALWVPFHFPLDAKPFHAYYQWKDCLIALGYVANWARALEVHLLDFLGHTWSLSMEEQFYLLWPALLVTLLKKCVPRWWIAMIALLLACAAWGVRVWLLYEGSTMMRLYNGLDTRADGLMVGCAAGILVASALVGSIASSWFRVVLSTLAVLALLWIGWCMLHIEWMDRWLYQWGFVSIELSAVVLILVLYYHPMGWVARFFSMPWLVWVGSISYGLYLWHYPIFRGLMMYDYDPNQVLVIGSTLAFGAATLSYYLLERPFLTLKKRFR